MFKKKFHTLIKRFLAGTLCLGLLASQPAVAYATEANVSVTPEAAHSST